MSEQQNNFPAPEITPRGESNLRPKEQQIIMTITHGQKIIHAHLVPSEEGSIDPFKFIDDNNEPIIPNQSDRLMAYTLSGQTPPQELIRGIETYHKIKKRKSKSKK